MLALRKNKKGFSLIELLIVIAIIAVIGAIAISLFTGVLGNSRQRADEQQARNIERALTTYTIESGDTDASEIGANLNANGATYVFSGGVTIEALQADINGFGPYLPSGDNVDFTPQANNGYTITVEGTTGEATVILN